MPRESFWCCEFQLLLARKHFIAFIHALIGSRAHAHSYLYAMGGSEIFQAGTLASFSLAGFIAQTFFGRFTGKIGYRPILAIAFTLVIIGNLTYALAPAWGEITNQCPCGSSCEGKWMIFFGRLFSGFGSGEWKGKKERGDILTHTHLLAHIRSFTYSLLYYLPTLCQSLARSLTHSLTHSLMHLRPLTHSLTHSLTQVD